MKTKKPRNTQFEKIGAGSSAENWGYYFELLVGWLETIRDSELEKAEEKPVYQERASKLSDLVDGLGELIE